MEFLAKVRVAIRLSTRIDVLGQFGKPENSFVVLCIDCYDQGRVSDSGGEEEFERRFVASHSIQAIPLGFSRGMNNVIGSRSLKSCQVDEIVVG